MPGVTADRAVIRVVDMRWTLGHRNLILITGLDDDELAHHALVLVQQHVAVVHVRHRRVGVILEAEGAA